MGLSNFTAAPFLFFGSFKNFSWFFMLMNESVEIDSRVDDEYISKLEMARRMAVSTRTIETWMHEGKVPFEKIGRTVRFHWGDVRSFLLSRNRNSSLVENQLRLTEGTKARFQELAASIRKRHRLNGICAV